jgi:hypothetical protein
VDHRLVRDRHIEACSHPALALYLFIVTVADHEGLSYYSDASLMSRLGMDAQTLDTARQNLIQAGLVAYEDPLYQVLSLEPSMAGPRSLENCPKVQGAQSEYFLPGLPSKKCFHPFFFDFAASIAVSIAASIAASGCRFAGQNYSCYPVVGLKKIPLN